MLETYRLHELDVQAAAWFPDGVRFASTALDKKLLVVDTSLE